MTKHRVAAVPYNIARVFVLRDKLMAETMVPFLGTELIGEWFDRLVEDLSEALVVDDPIIYDSIRHLAGSILDRKQAYILAWQLAGNLERLRDDIPVPRWFMQTEEEWLPVQILSWQADKTARGRSTNTYRMRVLAGTAATVLTTASWPLGFTRMLARQIGFTARRGKLPYQHPSEFVQLRLRILADPSRSKPGQLGFWEVAGGSGLTNWNKTILQMRARIGFACPESYTHPCYRCPVGYDNCDAACHKETIYTEAEPSAQ